MHRKYTVLIEKGPTSYGAYIPDIPGCFAAADTEEEVKELIVEAGIVHLADVDGGWGAHSGTAVGVSRRVSGCVTTVLRVRAERNVGSKPSLIPPWIIKVEGYTVRTTLCHAFWIPACAGMTGTLTE